MEGSATLGRALASEPMIEKQSPGGTFLKLLDLAEGDPECSLVSEKGRNALAYSEEEDRAFAKAKEIAQSLGMTIYEDRAKNVYATWFPPQVDRIKPRKSIAIGSHLDSVPNGGSYDGVLGVAMGFQLVEELQKLAMEGEVSLTRPITVCAFRGEESSRFGQACIGSMIASGSMKKDPDQLNLLDKKTGKTLREAIGIPEDEVSAMLHEQHLSKERFSHYFEVHIEQSSVIETENRKRPEGEYEKVIGIVTGGIGGAARERLQLEAVSSDEVSHAVAKIIEAARTLVDFRDSPAAPFRITVNIENNGKAVNTGSGKEKLLVDYLGVSDIRDEIRAAIGNTLMKSLEMEGAQIDVKDAMDEMIFEGSSFHTGGLPMNLRRGKYADMAVALAKATLVAQEYGAKVQIPGTENGKASLVLDYRGLDEGKMATMRKMTHDLIAQIAKDAGVSIVQHIQLSNSSPVKFTYGMVKLLKDAAKEAMVSVIELPSMPGHDAREAAKVGIPTAMLFVESRAGESHIATEYTEPEQFDLALKVLLEAVIEKAK